MAIIREIDVATSLTPKFTVSTEREVSPIKRAFVEWLKPTFTVKSDYVGDYTYAPYGKTEGSWIIPLFLGLLIWRGFGR